MIASVFVEAQRRQRSEIEDISTDSETNEGPGPGQYDIHKQSDFNVDKNPNSFFGSLCDRFPKFKSTTIGPGKYDVGTFHLDNLKHKGFTAAFAKGD